jgi:hypothetical protein
MTGGCVRFNYEYMDVVYSMKITAASLYEIYRHYIQNEQECPTYIQDYTVTMTCMPGKDTIECRLFMYHNNRSFAPNNTHIRIDENGKFLYKGAFMYMRYLMNAMKVLIVTAIKDRPTAIIHKSILVNNVTRIPVKDAINDIDIEDIGDSDPD